MTDCVIPGCHAQVDNSGDTCIGCVQIFGQMLRPTATRMSAEQIRARDTQVRNAYQLQKGEIHA